MDDEKKNGLKRKLEKTFLKVVRKGFNDRKAEERVASLRGKFPGLTRDALADVLIKRATRKTSATGAGSGLAITGCEVLVAAPVPEPGHKAAAGAGVLASIAGDLTATTAIQMQLLLDISHVYNCPFDESDEEDVWLIYGAAQGLKGVEQVGAYVRFVFKEAAKKQFRSLLRTGIRRGLQAQVIKVAGRQVGKTLAEKYILRLIPIANIGIGLIYNRWLTKRVGRWAKVRARIRSGMFRVVEKIRAEDKDVGGLLLPLIFHVGTAADKLTDNTLVLYAQTAKLLGLSDEEGAAISDLNEDGSLEDFLHENTERLNKGCLPGLLMEAAIITAASSRLEFVEEHGECLKTLAEGFGVDYTDSSLRQKIKELLAK